MDDVIKDNMRLALQLAKKAQGKTSPNPMVGAILIKNQKIIAKGWHKRCGGAHAEIVALKQAGTKAKGATLYVTLEPCFHHGRTPPCVDSIIRSGIKKVVVGMKDPNPLVNGKSIAKLRRAGIYVKVGVLQKELMQLNEAFVKHTTTRLPFVVAKTAQTLDGKIATAKGHSQWITSAKTRAFARRMRDQFDAIIVGVNTVLKDDPRLTGQAKGKRLKKVILDSTLRMPLKAQLLSCSPKEDIIIITTSKASDRRIKTFQDKGINVMISSQAEGRVDWRWVLKTLGQQNIIHVLIEGGAQTVGSALKAGCVDKLHVYVAPKICGDAKALDSVVGLHPAVIDQTIALKDVTLTTIDRDVFFQAYIREA